MMTPTEYDAYCLHDAVKGIGTTESVLIGILCTRTAQVNNYKSQHDFQQCDILTCVDSNEPVQPPFKLKNSKWRSVGS